LTYRWSRGAKPEALGTVADATHEVVEVAAGELPLERLGDLLVAMAER
jgi:hypothetical protein